MHFFTRYQHSWFEDPLSAMKTDTEVNSLSQAFSRMQKYADVLPNIRIPGLSIHEMLWKAAQHLRVWAKQLQNHWKTCTSMQKVAWGHIASTDKQWK